jgi:hypothetical protein
VSRADDATCVPPGSILYARPRSALAREARAGTRQRADIVAGEEAVAEPGPGVDINRRSPLDWAHNIAATLIPSRNARDWPHTPLRARRSSEELADYDKYTVPYMGLTHHG